MARRCDLTNKDAQSGNSVSHAQNKTRRTFKVNVQNVTLYSDALKQKISAKIAISTLRSIDHNGGLDTYLSKISDSKLSEFGQKLKRKVRKALEAQAATNPKKAVKKTEEKAAA